MEMKASTNAAEIRERIRAGYARGMGGLPLTGTPTPSPRRSRKSRGPA